MAADLDQDIPNWFSHVPCSIGNSFEECTAATPRRRLKQVWRVSSGWLFKRCQRVEGMHLVVAVKHRRQQHGIQQHGWSNFRLISSQPAAETAASKGARD
jgi:hypothetical protein